ncbi:alginate O-acetyltransferase AlgX-related protein [Enterovirga aerilata]|uniref:AlgX/AlgJ SGNH hydrolase-like domain-containing protein n=1 Tax=Enterovirga aerilata TaxID=2730920 RepID=A0A849I3Y8_9HYPH|nr:hypothetical protein [Enterovirga sp. DB1703]NNM71099.1 hypothetical protein [Enterovirga sp. DB1703]
MFPRRRIPVVHVGKDGWLFLAGGRNRPIDMYRRRIGTAWRAHAWARLIRTRAERFRARGILYRHAVVPEKLSLYPEFTAGLRYDPARGYAARLGRRPDLQPVLVDILGALAEAKGRAQLYHRTDTHWTTEGCLAAHDAICAALGASRSWRLEDRPYIAQDIAGDLGVKLDPPVGETRRQHHVTLAAAPVWRNALLSRAEASGTIADLHRGAAITYAQGGPEADPRRVLLFGDSLSHFYPMLLTGMLAETFRELHFVWSASVDWTLVDRIRPDIVVTEIAERFMAEVPADDFDLEAFVGERLRTA